MPSNLLRALLRILDRLLAALPPATARKPHAKFGRGQKDGRFRSRKTRHNTGWGSCQNWKRSKTAAQGQSCLIHVRLLLRRHIAYLPASSIANIRAPRSYYEEPAPANGKFCFWRQYYQRIHSGPRGLTRHATIRHQTGQLRSGLR